MNSSQLCNVDSIMVISNLQNNIFQTYKKLQMNNLRNKVSLIGRLGGTPEFVTTEGGKVLARFSLAVSNNYKDKKGNWVDDTQWHNVNAWGKTAELVKDNLDKGQEIIIEGRVVNRSYETKTGEKRYSTVIEMNEFLTLSSGSKK